MDYTTAKKVKSMATARASHNNRYAMDALGRGGWWARSYPSVWIEIDLGSIMYIREIILTLGHDIYDLTTRHSVTVGCTPNLDEFETISLGEGRIGDKLFMSVYNDIRYFRITTTGTTSEVNWRDISFR